MRYLAQYSTLVRAFLLLPACVGRHHCRLFSLSPFSCGISLKPSNRTVFGCSATTCSFWACFLLSVNVSPYPPAVCCNRILLAMTLSYEGLVPCAIRRYLADSCGDVHTPERDVLVPLLSTTAGKLPVFAAFRFFLACRRWARMIMTAPSCTGTRSTTSHPRNGERVGRAHANVVYFSPSDQSDDDDDDDDGAEGSQDVNCCKLSVSVWIMYALWLPPSRTFVLR